MFQTLLTDATCEVRVEVVGEERFRQLSEVQLQCPCDGVHIHLTHHYRHIFMICRSKLGSGDAAVLLDVTLSPFTQQHIRGQSTTRRFCVCLSTFTDFFITFNSVLDMNYVEILP